MPRAKNKKRWLNDEQTKQLAQTSGNIGLIFFGAIVVPSIIQGEISDPELFVEGLVLSLFFWYASIGLLRRFKK